MKAGVASVQNWVMGGNPTDPYVVLSATLISIRGRWFKWLALVFRLSYQPGTW